MRYDAETMKKKISYSHFEDEDGNIIERDENDARRPDFDCVYVHGYPTTYIEHFDRYCRRFTKKQKMLMRLPIFGKMFRKKYEKSTPRTFNRMFSANDGWPEEVALAMANSGDYKLREAIWVLAHCCERCMNVLAYKYLDGKDGYEYESEEYNKGNTACIYCRDRVDNPSCM